MAAADRPGWRREWGETRQTAIVKLVLLLLALPQQACASYNSFHAIVCDAGSTGTRVYVYKIDKDGSLDSITGKKVKPGLAQIDPKDGAEYLLPLIEDAGKHIPESEKKRTPVYVIATAGMRLQPKKRQDLIFSKVVEGLPKLLEKKKLPFVIESSHFRTASGKEEGYWGFLAANFLEKRMKVNLEAKVGKAFAGVLDLGGSSTQISYKCGSEPGPSNSKVELGNMFVHSFLGYGGVKANERLQKAIQGPNPCDFKGYKRSSGEKPSDGTGNAEECRALIRKQVIPSEPCSEPPCFFDNVHKPSEPICGDFLAISLYYFAMDCLLNYAKQKQGQQATPAVTSFIKHWPRPSVQDIQDSADEFCSEEWSAVMKWKHSETPTSQSWSGRCFEVNYIAELLKSGYGLPATARNVTFVKDIDGAEVEWTLGAFLQERLVVTTDPGMEPSSSGLDLSEYGTGEYFGPFLLIFVLMAIPCYLVALKANRSPFRFVASSLDSWIGVPKEPVVESEELAVMKNGDQAKEIAGNTA